MGVGKGPKPSSDRTGAMYYTPLQTTTAAQHRQGPTRLETVYRIVKQVECHYYIHIILVICSGHPESVAADMQSTTIGCQCTST